MDNNNNNNDMCHTKIVFYLQLACPPLSPVRSARLPRQSAPTFIQACARGMGRAMPSSSLLPERAIIIIIIIIDVVRNPRHIVAMSLFPSTARNGVSAMVGLRSTPTAILRRSFTPLAAVGMAPARQQQMQQQQQPPMAYIKSTPSSLAMQMMVRPFMHSAKRPASANMTPYTQGEALKMLNEQRSLRPNSPHLTIYQPQLTWYLSIFNRMTGVGISASAFNVSTHS